MVHQSPVQGTGASVLLYANSNDLWFVCVLYLDVNWHGVLPLLVLYFLFYIFTAARSFALRERGL